jgi:CRP/FNR family transcriptional regulator
MRTPYGMKIIDNCLNCPARDDRLFCGLSADALQKINELKSTAIYPKGATLFIEGQQARGVFILCSGKAKLSVSSQDGKTIITRICKSGDVLGLGASLVNHPHEVTAEMIESGQANFISRDSILVLSKENSEVAMRVGRQLSINYFKACEEIRMLGISRSPAEKFAKLLLSWYPEKAMDSGAQVKVTFTHGEIAEMIGTTRETVTRLFTEFTKKKLLQRVGATLLFRNKPALEDMVHC